MAGRFQATSIKVMQDGVVEKYTPGPSSRTSHCEVRAAETFFRGARSTSSADASQLTGRFRVVRVRAPRQELLRLLGRAEGVALAELVALSA